MKKSLLLSESLQVSIDAINIYKYLIKKKEYVLSNQFLRSATSIGANIREAKYSESKKDFIHKFKIALKECNETLYCLELIKYNEGEELEELKVFTKRCMAVLRMIAASIKTCQEGLNDSKEL